MPAKAAWTAARTGQRSGYALPSNASLSRMQPMKIPMASGTRSATRLRAWARNASVLSPRSLASSGVAGILDLV